MLRVCPFLTMQFKYHSTRFCFLLFCLCFNWGSNLVPAALFVSSRVMAKDAGLWLVGKEREGRPKRYRQHKNIPAYFKSQTLFKLYSSCHVNLTWLMLMCVKTLHYGLSMKSRCLRVWWLVGKSKWMRGFKASFHRGCVASLSLFSYLVRDKKPQKKFTIAHVYVVVYVFVCLCCVYKTMLQWFDSCFCESHQGSTDL